MNMINEHVAEIDMKHVCVSLSVCARVCVCVCVFVDCIACPFKRDRDTSITDEQW